MSDVSTEGWCVPHDSFETLEECRQEDQRRRRQAEKILASQMAAATNNFDEGGPIVRHAPPWLRMQPVTWLISTLKLGLQRHYRSPASREYMRGVRQRVIGGILHFFAPFADEEIRTAVVLKAGWVVTPEQLMQLSAAQVKNQFLTDLKKTGIATIPGPLVAFLEGEWEPNGGCWFLHWNVLTTAEKAAALDRLRNLAPYKPTAFIKRPIRVEQVRDRARQFSYLLKSFWCERPVIDGKRVHDVRRVHEPHSTIYLSWLAQQTLDDMTVLNGVWSYRKGGSAAGRQLYLLVKGASRQNRRRRGQAGERHQRASVR